MSDKKNNSEKEYTVDDILAEFGSDEAPAAEMSDTETDSTSDAPQETEAAPANETAELKNELAELKAELAMIKEELAAYKKSNAAEPEQPAEHPEAVPTLAPDSLEDSPEEGYDPDSAYEGSMSVTPILEDTAPAALFSEEVVPQEDLFEKTDEERAQAAENILAKPTLQDEINDIIGSIWEPSVEISSEDSDSDEAAFEEELSEELVTPEQIAEQSETAAEDNDIIIDDGAEYNISDSKETEAHEQPQPPQTPEQNNAEAEKDEAETISKEEGKPMADTNIPSEEENEKKPFWQNIIPWKGDDIGEIIRKLIFIAAVVVFIIAGIMLLTTMGDSQVALEDADDNRNIIETTVATTIGTDGEVITIAPTEDEIIEHNIDVMQKYKEISENVIGYIELSGCDLFQPVVQGEDNDYYLTHTYYDEKNKGGSIFADYRCRIEEDYTSPNLVLYGHNQEDGTMFGNLKNYKQNIEFYANNPIVTIGTDYGVSKYIIYGFFVTNALENQDTYGEVFHYHDYIETMNDEYTFNWYLGEVMERNQIISPVDVEFGDQLLCLSTCSNEFSNSRFVVFARKLRDGESAEDYDLTKTYFNPNARGVDWSAIMSGETSEESTEESLEESLSETEETTEETTVPSETEESETEKTKKTKETSKTKRVDRTKTAYSHTFNTTGEETEETLLTDENGVVITEPTVTDENGNIVTTVPATDENGETVTSVPASAGEITGTQTAGITQ
ncbi:MAG: sortase [Oscillospiraceae bacterium]|nr:sortase [Oscillospiraceae bacterium]